MGNKIVYKGYNVGETTQVSIMSTPTADNSGAIVQYVGATNANYINGYFYKCVSDGGVTPAYSWEKIQVSDGGDTIQVDELPIASADELGNIYEFVGTTTANYINGRFYRCVSDGASTPTYTWEEVNFGDGTPVFIGTSSEWESETSKTDYQVAILTDQPTVNAVDSTDGSTTVVGEPNKRWTGSQNEWSNLSAAEKAEFEIVCFNDDNGTSGKDVYSTTETKTNKVWIDGKPIYRKVITATAIAETQITISSIPNVDKITEIDGVFKTSNNIHNLNYSHDGVYVLAFYSWIQGTVEVVSSGNYEVTVKLEYTKVGD